MTPNQLYKEFIKYRDELALSGAGVSLVQRALTPPTIVAQIEESEKTMGKEKIKELVIKTLARYMLLIEKRPGFFDFIAANHLSRALFNNDIKDEELRDWCFNAREFGNTDRIIPQNLQAEIDFIKQQP